MIIVKKRVSTRLFLEARGQMSNPPPGTLVDSVVTRPEWFDFFLISQSVRQGTVTPTHYNVVNDSTGLKADHFQRLTYKLCHLYYNWPVSCFSLILYFVMVCQLIYCYVWFIPKKYRFPRQKRMYLTSLNTVTWRRVHTGQGKPGISGKWVILKKSGKT